MEKLKIAVGKALPRKDIKSSGNILDAIAQVSGTSGGNIVISHDKNGGMSRLKIVMRREGLKKVVDQLVIMKSKEINNNLRSDSSTTTTMTLEHHLNLMRRRRSSVKARCRSSCSWRPALHSIPEEF